MSAPVTPLDAEVQRWLAGDPVGPGPQRAAAWARFVLIRSRLLRHLRRGPRRGLLQGRTVLRGLARLGLAPPVLACWEPVVWPAVVGGGLLGLVRVDSLLGQRLSGCRHVCVVRAARVAWAVVAAEPPAAAGPAEPPGSSAATTKRTMEYEERERCCAGWSSL